jgi:Thioesterase-like superfamily
MPSSTADADDEPATPYFRRDGNHFIPDGIARGGWGPTLSGHVIGGLLSWAAEQTVEHPDFQPARLTVDLPAPVPLEPLQVRTQVHHERRRLKLVEASLIQHGDTVARATALFLRRGPQPDGVVWSPPVQMPQLPTEIEDKQTLFIRTYGWGIDLQNPDPQWDNNFGEKYTWLQETRPLVGGEPLTAFNRAAMAGDVTAAIANWGTEGLQFINVDYTVTLSRLPDGPYIGLASLTHSSHDGVATGSAVLVDQAGPIGTGVSIAVAHNGFRAPSAVTSE